MNPCQRLQFPCPELIVCEVDNLFYVFRGCNSIEKIPVFLLIRKVIDVNVSLYKSIEIVNRKA